MKSTLLSVIIPTFNRPDSIIRAIDSVLGQHIEGMEVIVVDDGDSQETFTLLEKYIEKRKILYVKNLTETHGPGLARNLGVSHAKGTYITFLDDDDMYIPGRLSNMLSVIKLHRYIFVSSGRFCEIDNLKIIQKVKYQLQGIINIDHILYGNDIDVGFMMKRDDFSKIGGFDTSLKNLEDWDIVLRMLMIGDGFKLQRFDYAVNINRGRSRVSEDDYIGYMQLADKYRSDFGSEWNIYMQVMIAKNKGILNSKKALKMACSYRSLAPIKVLIKAGLVLLKRICLLRCNFLDRD